MSSGGFSSAGDPALAESILRAQAIAASLGVQTPGGGVGGASAAQTPPPSISSGGLHRQPSAGGFSVPPRPPSVCTPECLPGSGARGGMGSQRSEGWSSVEAAAAIAAQQRQVRLGWPRFEAWHFKRVLLARLLLERVCLSVCSKLRSALAVVLCGR